MVKDNLGRLVKVSLSEKVNLQVRLQYLKGASLVQICRESILGRENNMCKIPSIVKKGASEDEV